MHDPKKAHYVSVTTIVVKDGKYLITQRADSEKNFPGLWTVPGGKVETQDYKHRDKDSDDAWYNVLEDVAKREVLEETGIVVDNLKYVTSLVFERPDGIPTLVVSLFGDYVSGEINLSDEMKDHNWVSLEDAKKYDFISGIYEEIELVDKHLKGNALESWGGLNDK